ncbi:unnamed protein product [Caenorhabditis sp. 36 PRJEB53466]|nr:unnamed protein product [Caenorhabditis sp. 36 PRJEB53466]
MQRLRDLFNGAFSKLSPIRRIRRKRAFRLLDLPSVPLLKCLGMFGIIERCSFSKCSKTAKAALMSLKKEINFFMAYAQVPFRIVVGFGVNLNDDYTLHIGQLEDLNDLKMGVERPQSYWKVRQSELLAEVEHYKEALRTPLKGILEHAEFTQQDLNRFVKLWMAGANPRLENLFIFRNIRANVMVNELDLVDGVQFLRIDKLVKRHYLVKENAMPPIKRICSGGLDIVRQDGVEATIESYPCDGLDMHAFNFIVWPHSSSEWLEMVHSS